MNELEDLLNQEQLYVMNSRSIMQHSVIDIPRNQQEKKEMRAKGNAQLMDFISLVGLIVESVLSDTDTKITYMPKSKAYFSREDADERFKNPIITYQVMHRKIKDKTSKSPILRDSSTEIDDDRTYEVYSLSYESVVRFQFLSLEYNTAFKIMDAFEDLMLEYKSYIREKGIVNYYLLEQQPDDYNVDFRDQIDELTLDYYVETQKNKVIFKENAKTLILNGEAVDEEFNPIPTSPEYQNK